MDLNRSALPGLPARRRWRNLPTSGVLRICNFSEAVGVAVGCGGGHWVDRRPAATVICAHNQGPHRPATCWMPVLTTEEYLRRNVWTEGPVLLRCADTAYCWLSEEALISLCPRVCSWLGFSLFNKHTFIFLK